LKYLPSYIALKLLRFKKERVQNRIKAEIPVEKNSIDTPLQASFGSLYYAGRVLFLLNQNQSLNKRKMLLLTL